MNTENRYVVEGFKVPSNDPITENELVWIHLLRSALGDAGPPPSMAGVLALGIALIDDRRSEVRQNVDKNAEGKPD